MKRLYLAMGLLLTFSLVGFAQYNNYKLENYVNPNYKRKALDLEFGTFGNLEKTTTNENNSYGGNLNLKFNSIANSEKTQENTTITTLGQGNHSSTTDQKNTYTQVGFSVEREAFHFKENKLFFEISPTGYVYYQYSKNKATNNYYNVVDVDKTNDLKAYASVKLGIGKGRIENVTDARQAVYILEELTKRGIINQTLTDDEVNAFASQISLVKNKRRFDSRLALIDEITVIDSFLVANKYIEKANSSVYFTSLYDKWLYGDRDLRESGSYFKVGINPQYSYFDYRSNGQSSETYVYAGKLYIDYKNEKPLDLKWQRSIYAGLSSGYLKYNSVDDGAITSSLQASYALGYYMNTRTYIQGKASQTFAWNRFNGDPKEDQLYSFTNIGMNAYYYLSPQLRLSGSLGLSYDFLRNVQDNQNLHDKYPHTTFSFGLSYAIF